MAKKKTAKKKTAKSSKKKGSGSGRKGSGKSTGKASTTKSSGSRKKSSTKRSSGSGSKSSGKSVSKGSTGKKSGGKSAKKKSAASASKKRRRKKNASSGSRKKKSRKRTRETAQSMGKRQRDISISEFFTKNRHLLGFDNPSRALLTTIKEAVDNSLDACEEAGILPDIRIVVTQMKDQEDRFTVGVRDNGPGIVRKQIPNIFGKLLYGSKFHRLKMARGQQGIGISAAGMYGQLTTGSPVRIISRTSARRPAHRFEVTIDTQKNKPRIETDEKVDWDGEHGTQVEIDLEAKYQKGRWSIDEYIRQTAIANPHVSILYTTAEGKTHKYERSAKTLPDDPREIKPHPYGVELGVLIKMLHATRSRTVKGCLRRDFCRVSNRVAEEILDRADIYVNARPSRIARQEADRLLAAIKQTKIMNPPTNCISPIGEELILKGLALIDADFYTAVTRSPSVYRGNPFLVEVGIAYGGEVRDDNTIRLLRYANRVPLLYQQGACVISQAASETSWRNYGLSQSGDNLPQGPAVVLVHVASVWVPFTSESKEAIAHYPEILKEIKLGLQECGRQMRVHINRRRREREARKKREYISSYIPHISNALRNILALNDRGEQRITDVLTDVLEKSRKM